MMSTVFDVVLLLALPASGKSEVRKLLSTVPADKLREDFHIGDNLQLDDFPYVFLMRRIDEELERLGKDPIYYPGQNPFIDGRDWGTLINLLNEDFVRRDTIWFADKNEQAETELVRLSSLGLHKNISPYNAYRQGKLVKLPFTGAIYLDDTTEGEQ